MKILVFGNGSLLVSNQDRDFTIEAAKKHDVVLLTNKPYYINDTILNTVSTVIDIRDPVNPELIDDCDVCIGFDQSTVPVVLSHKKRTKCKAYCIFLDFPVNIVESTGNIDYNLAYAQRFFYWLNCSLEIDGVFCTNTTFAYEYKKRYNRDAKIIDFAIDCGDIEISKDKSMDFVVGCCRLFSWKGVEYCLKALRKTDLSYKHIYRSGSEQEITKLRQLSNQIENNVDFYENVSVQNKMKLLNNASFLVHVQNVEYFGSLAPIEAGSVYTPSIVFDLQVNRDLYGDSVVYTEMNNISKLRGAMVNFDRDKIAEYGEKARTLYEDRFTTEKMAKAILENI